jgi:hypothetical protein
MANERIPDDDFYRSSRYESDLPPLDRNLDEGGPSGGKVALFAVAVALLLGAVFYGLNNTSTHQATNPPPAQSAQSQPSLPQAPPATRDMTPPRPNTEPGTTTGAAPAQPTMPPSTAPSTMNRDAPKQ